MKFSLGLFFYSAGLAACLLAKHATAGDVEYNRDILPILSDRCFQCHGPDEHTREGGVRFDLEESAKGLADSGERAVVPGDLEASELLRRVESDDEFELMPPPDSRKEPLSEEQIELLRRWVRQGAEYQPHWAYVTPKPAKAPAAEHPGESANWIDLFIADRLNKEGLLPAELADRRTLLRRVTFDLTGLPPTKSQVDAFLGDDSDDAFEKVVDRLLDSPRYGERMAMWWLDLVRYADTVGYHGDQDHRTWPYRDWVINAFNENKPFDEFTIEQLAGDLLDHPTDQQLVATAYNRLLQTSHEGGAQLKEYRSIYQADRIRNFSQVWMGATVGCAQCHSHKYDPYSIRDFYSLGAFFADVDDEEHLTNQYGGLNALPTRRSPEMPVRTADMAVKIKQFEKQLVAARSRLAQAEQELVVQLPELESSLQRRLSAGDATEQVWIDDVQDTGGSISGDWKFVTAPEHPVFSGKRSRIQTSKGQVQHYFKDAKKEFKLGESSTIFAWVYLDPANPPTALMLQFNIAGDWEHRAVWGSEDISYGRRKEDHDGHRRQGELPASGQWVRLSVAAEEVGLKAGTIVGGMAYTQFGGRAYWDRAGQSSAPVLPTGVAAAIAKEISQRTVQEAKELRSFLLKEAEALKPIRREITELTNELKAAEDDSPKVVYTKALVEPRVVRVQPRGNWLDETGEIVQPAIPHFMGKLKVGDRRATRLDLARWLVTDSADGGVGELTARVQANRLWQLLTGVGISRVLDDFGGQGEPPVHPELLDRLALELVGSGWDVKALLKQMVLSHTYRQSSVSTPELRDADPNNRLYAVQSRPRMAAEMIRDNALAISGLLQSEIGGPSVKPYQPEGYYSHLNFPKRKYRQSEDVGQWRRGLYVHWQRQFLHPMLKAFDAPTREECTAQRSASNTPTAALVLLNDPTFVEAARVFAARILTEGGDDDAKRIDWAFGQSLGRPVKDRESKVLLNLLSHHRDHFGAHPEQADAAKSVGLSKAGDGLDPVELAAWTSVARAIFNLNELITRN